MKIFFIKLLIFILTCIGYPLALIVNLIDTVLWDLHTHIPVVTRFKKHN
jgi:hypothetical protein